MRTINISNEKKRDAAVCFEGGCKRIRINYILADRSPKRNVKIAKASLHASDDVIFKQYKDLKSLGEEIIRGDPEIDLENAGKIISKTRKLYLNKNHEIAYRVNLMQIIRNPDGTEKERRELTKLDSNILGEIPLQWTGKKIPKDLAVKKYVFSMKYQIKHVNGLTYDFLYEMAQNLHESNSFMFVGAGKKGTDPIVLQHGGTPYRGFLEGRVDGERYCLILHLTNLELKGVLKNVDG